MMNFSGGMFWFALTLLVGGGDAEGAVLGEKAATKVAQTAGDQSVFLRSLPEACEYLSESFARDLLQAEVTQRQPASGGCAYKGAGGSGKYVSFSMFMWGLNMLDSSTEPREKLQEKAGFLAGGQTPVATLDQPGNIAFVFKKDDSTSLVILTGIAGTAVMSDRIVSELSISYNLSDPDQTHEARLAQLLTLANDHLGRLRKLAGTTHEGRPAF